MATSTGKTLCLKCNKVKCTSRCGGCLQDFCFKHMEDHRQELNQQLDEIVLDHDLFRQSLNEQMKDPKCHSLMKEVDIWERESIERIRQTAEDTRLSLSKNITKDINQIETKVGHLAKQLTTVREEDDYNEINLNQFKNDLKELKKQLTNPSNISIHKDVSSYINKLHINTLGLESVTETCENNIYTSKMARLMSKLGTTHQQIGEYSRRRIQQIDEEVATAINRIVAETQIQQQTLLADANVRSAAIEEEYKHKLQRYVEEINTVKAQNLSLLEKDLNLRQEMILEEARKRIDDLNEEANRLKMGVLHDAQAPTNAKVEAITEQAAASSAKDAAVVVGATPKIKLKHRQQ